MTEAIYLLTVAEKERQKEKLNGQIPGALGQIG
jgi:hypothetical protein